MNLRSLTLTGPLLAVSLLGACVESGPTASGAPEAKVLAGVDLSGEARSTGSPANPHIRYVGGDGSSLAKAVRIKGAAGESDGIQSEYDWIAMNLPGWKPSKQALLEDNGRYYDLLTLRKGGSSREVYFDISEYFGR